MKKIIEWVLATDLINYANYFFAGFLGSIAWLLKEISEKQTEKIAFWRLLLRAISNGILGGFAGLLITNFFKTKSFNYGISGLAGFLGTGNTIKALEYFIKNMTEGKIVIEKEERDE